MIATTMLALILLWNAAAIEDAALGTWRFKPAQSIYESGPAPRESKRVWERVGDKVRFVHTGVSHDGKVFRVQFTARYDGRDYPVEGSSRYNTVSLKLIDAHRVEQTFKKSDVVTVEAVREVSPDGRWMTIIARGRNTQDRTFKNTLVYEREKPPR